jgi:hypothetical protein
MQTFLDYIDETPRHRQDLNAVSQFVAQQLYASIRSIHSSADIDEKVADLSNMVSLTAATALIVLGSIEDNRQLLNQAKNIIRAVQR